MFPSRQRHDRRLAAIWDEQEMSDYAPPSMAGGVMMAGYWLGGLNLVLETLALVTATGLLLRLLWRRGKSLRDV